MFTKQIYLFIQIAEVAESKHAVYDVGHLLRWKLRQYLEPINHKDIQQTQASGPNAQQTNSNTLQEEYSWGVGPHNAGRNNESYCAFI